MQMKSTGNLFPRILVTTPVILIFTVWLVGVWALRNMPVLGLRLSFCREGAKVVTVEDEGPAAGLILPGERLVAIGNVQLVRDDLLRFPEFVRNADEQAWWTRQRAIFTQLQIQQPVPVVVAALGAQEERTVWLRSSRWTWTSVLRRGFPIYLAGFIFICMSVIIYTCSQDLPHQVSQVFCAAAGLYHMATAPLVLREIVLNPVVAQGLAFTAFVAAGGGILLVHFSFIFPRRKRFLFKYPWVMWIPYMYYGISVLLYLTGVTAFGSTYLFVNFWSLVVIIATLHGYFSERDPLLQRQVLLFLMIPVLLVLFFCLYVVMPGVLRTGMVEYSYFAVFSIALGFSIALAVENQRIYLESLGQEQRNLRDRLEMVREMHDNFGNAVAGIAQLAEQGGRAPATAARTLRQVQQAAQDCLTDVRDFITAGDPASSLWTDYLIQCRARAAADLERLQIGLTMRTAVAPGCETLRPPVRYHLTGILREALGNIIKHSRAKHVTLVLAVQAGQAELCIEDDGSGFDPNRVPAGSHGLGNMMARARELGGTLQISSSERGTRLTLHFIP